MIDIVSCICSQIVDLYLVTLMEMKPAAWKFVLMMHQTLDCILDRRQWHDQMAANMPVYIKQTKIFDLFTAVLY